jgi:hypothetical protein
MVASVFSQNVVILDTFTQTVDWEKKSDRPYNVALAAVAKDAVADALDYWSVFRGDEPKFMFMI